MSIVAYGDRHLLRQMHEPTLVTASTLGDVVGIDTLRMHCRADSNDEDALLIGWQNTAVAMVERDAEIALLTSTWAVRLDGFPCDYIELRRPPVASITSIAYVDYDGTTQTLSASDYNADLYHRPARIEPAYGTVWPSARDSVNSVTVTFVAGNTSADLVSPIAKQAISTLVAHWYSNREAVGTVGQEISYTYEACIDRLRWAGGV